MGSTGTTIHASAVLVGATAVLIRGPAGAGKSRLAWELIAAATQGALPFARLVGDDRVHIDAHAGRLLVRPAQVLAGLLEIRGLGIRRLPYEPVAAIGLLVDLAAADAARLPEPEAFETALAGVLLPRLPVACEQAALPLVLGRLATLSAGD